ncbi:MAG: sensor histidine kinase [Anaerolineae bacterium]
MTYSSSNQIRRVNLIRYMLPLILFAIVMAYEGWEHWLLEGVFGYDFHLSLEVFFFGILGPTAVFIVLSYVMTLLKKQITFATELKSLNRSLEEQVGQRTKALAERNAELAHANEELQQLDQLKSDFVSLVSHELRGPLTTLNGGLELALQEAAHLPPKLRRMVQVMAHESRRLTEFVQTILDVSRLDAGQLELNLGPVAVVPLLNHVVSVVFADKKRQIDWDVPTSLPPLWADETYLEKIVSNLLTNADKYSSDGTTIGLSVRPARDCLAITVTDRGPGIPTVMQARIFERFQRGKSNGRDAAKGWGLGLYFAKMLAAAQGGQLTVRSPAYDNDEALGSAFTLTLPLTNEVPEDA